MRTVIQAIQNQPNSLYEVTGIDTTLQEIIRTETAIHFIEKLSVQEGRDMSKLVKLNMFWNIWERKWKEVDTLFLERLTQVSTKKGHRLADIAAEPNKRSYTQRYNYLSPFYYKCAFDADDEAVIFNTEDMLYHYTTLHQCSEAYSWAMQSLIYLMKVVKFSN
jgi:hypothetical protein